MQWLWATRKRVYVDRTTYLPPLCKGRWRGLPRRRDCFNKIVRNTIPQSATLTAPFTQGSLIKVLIFCCFPFLFYSSVNLFWTTRLSRGFLDTKRQGILCMPCLFCVFITGARKGRRRSRDKTSGYEVLSARGRVGAKRRLHFYPWKIENFAFFNEVALRG